jgi:S-adenosylmethionine:tRNA ribosyltransferase-isomerase
MPSAGRAFTPELVTQLVAAGIDVAPLVLHTGVSSLEAGERPHPEWFSVPPFTAERANLARLLGGRVIAVGTTVVRALESPGRRGWTDLVVEPDTPIRNVDGLLSGFHDHDSSHLSMLEAVAGRELLERSYEEATAAGYLRHEFGDLHLILP